MDWQILLFLLIVIVAIVCILIALDRFVGDAKYGINMDNNSIDYIYDAFNNFSKIKDQLITSGLNVTIPNPILFYNFLMFQKIAPNIEETILTEEFKTIRNLFKDTPRTIGLTTGLLDTNTNNIDLLLKSIKEIRSEYVGKSTDIGYILILQYNLEYSFHKFNRENLNNTDIQHVFDLFSRFVLMTYLYKKYYELVFKNNKKSIMKTFGKNYLNQIDLMNFQVF